MSAYGLRRGWAGTPTDVYDLLRKHVWEVADVTLRAYVDAIDVGHDPVAAMQQAHFGQIVAGLQYDAAKMMADRVEGIVAYLRHQGANVL